MHCVTASVPGLLDHQPPSTPAILHDNTLPLQMMLMTMTMTMKPMMMTQPKTAQTNQPKKTIICAPYCFTATVPTISDPPPLTQSTEDIVNDDEDDFPLMMPMMVKLTSMTAPEKTEMTEKPMHCAPPKPTATAFTPRHLTPLMQSAADITADIEDDFPMILPMMPMTTPMIEKTVMTMKPMLASTSPLPNLPPLMQFANDIEDDFPMMMLTMKLMTTTRPKQQRHQH